MTTQALQSQFEPKGVEPDQQNKRLDDSRKSLWSSLVAFVGQKVNNWIEFREKRAALEHLSTLDDRLLADIGISRAEVYARLEKPYSEPVSWPPKSPTPL